MHSVFAWESSVEDHTHTGKLHFPKFLSVHTAAVDGGYVVGKTALFG